VTRRQSVERGPQAAFSIDVEDWYHAELPAIHLRKKGLRRESFPSVLVEGTRKILELLRVSGSTGTFFFVGEVIEQYPFLVQEALDQGHEVGCHGWSHRMLTTLDANEFDGELKKFRTMYETFGFPGGVIGFRAPSFSLCQKTAWALEVLEANGFLYDSSIFPMRTFLYGVPGAQRRIYRPDANDIRYPRGGDVGILELPMTVWPNSRRWGVPVSGGLRVG